MASLKSLLPKLSEILEVPTVALYERQRALVRIDRLPTPIGRGRGSGPEASAKNVAALILAVMWAEKLTEVNDDLVALLDAHCRGPDGMRQRCEVTNQPTLEKALTWLLRQKDTNDLDQFIEPRVRITRRGVRRAEIRFMQRGKRQLRSWFGPPMIDRIETLTIYAELPPLAFISVIDLLQKVEKEALE